MFWIELGEGFACRWVGALSGEPGQDFALGRHDEGTAFTEAKCGGELFRGRALFEVRDHQVDVVLFVAVELLELCDLNDSPINAELSVTVIASPVGQWFVVTFAAAYQGGAKQELLCFGLCQNRF